MVLEDTVCDASVSLTLNLCELKAYQGLLAHQSVLLIANHFLLVLIKRLLAYFVHAVLHFAFVHKGVMRRNFARRRSVQGNLALFATLLILVGTILRKLLLY